MRHCEANLRCVCVPLLIQSQETEAMQQTNRRAKRKKERARLGCSSRAVPPFPIAGLFIIIEQLSCEVQAPVGGLQQRRGVIGAADAGEVHKLCEQSHLLLL